MKAGQWIFDLAGKPDFGTAGIQAAYAVSLAQIALEPSVATRIVLSARESWRARLLAWTHYATIPLFVLWIAFTVFRPRTRNTFGRVA
jgi:cyanate permease